METTRSERIKLGAFMLFCGVLICVFLGYVLKRYLSEQYDNYYTIFDTDVNGLFVDAKVKLNGIAVGSVTNITINEKDLNQVVVEFKVQRGTPIKIGTRAGMTAGMNLTGEKQVILSGGVVLSANRTSPKAASSRQRPRCSIRLQAKWATSLAKSIRLLTGSSVC